MAYIKTDNPMDIWIIQHINTLTTQMTKMMDNYELSRATKKCVDMIDDITNWYLKFNRDRLKGKNGDIEWVISTSTLFQVIMKYITLLAPFTPFITQYIYDILKDNIPDYILDDILDDIPGNTIFKYSYIHELPYDSIIKLPDIVNSFGKGTIPFEPGTRFGGIPPSIVGFGSSQFPQTWTPEQTNAPYDKNFNFSNLT
jgi:hypothetical protein